MARSNGEVVSATVSETKSACNSDFNGYHHVHIDIFIVGIVLDIIQLHLKTQNLYHKFLFQHWKLGFTLLLLASALKPSFNPSSLMQFSNWKLAANLSISKAFVLEELCELMTRYSDMRNSQTERSTCRSKDHVGGYMMFVRCSGTIALRLSTAWDVVTAEATLCE
jgi:hypothetical protein